MSKKRLERVNVIIAGFEWECPDCGEYHTMCNFDNETARKHLICQKCGHKFQGYFDATDVFDIG